MKPIELDANDANVYETFSKDAIQRNETVFSLLEILSIKDYNYTIAIDSEWGGGKTFFIKQCAMILDAHVGNEHSMFRTHFSKIKEKCKGKKLPESTLAVYYDAWLNDSEQDPLLSILFQIIESQGIDVSKDRDLLKITDNFIAAITSIIPWSVNVKFKNLVEDCEGIDIFESIKTPRKILELWESILTKLFESTNTNRIVIFIDELDRCRPTFAIRLLERVKHYFIQDSVTCVYAINSSQLQHTIKSEYGEGFNGSKYLERFFNVRFSLPVLDPMLYAHYIDESCDGFNSKGVVIIDIICNLYQFSIRDMARYYEKAESLRIKYINSIKPEYNEFEINILIPLLVGIKILDNNIYDNFVNGNAQDVMENIFLKSHNQALLWYWHQPASAFPQSQNPEWVIDKLYKFLFYPGRPQNNKIAIGRLTFDSYILNLVHDLKSEL